MRRALPSLLTLAGLALRLLALGGALPPAWGLLGLACDALDGAAARRLGAVTDFGRELDWHGDCACAGVALATIAARLGSPLVLGGGLVALVTVWAWHHARGVRVSVSSPLVLAALALA